LRYHLLATDYDGTLATDGRVDQETINALMAYKATHRKLVMVTGRELPDIQQVFPAYKIFDYIIAENGALIHNVENGSEELIGEGPGLEFIEKLHQRGVYPLAVGKVIVATREPNEKKVLEVIKESGIERQVIFNKGAVMILPPGVNKATGLNCLLKNLHFSAHNTISIGDAENDGALLQVAEYSVAVGNALQGLKEIADYTTTSSEGEGVSELIGHILDHEQLPTGLNHKRHCIQLGTKENGEAFNISPWRSGILLSGVSGAGKTTFTVSITESLIHKNYQFVLIDPEGDYSDLPGAVVIGKDGTLPAFSEISDLMKDPSYNIVISFLSVPLADRPVFFVKLLTVLLQLRREFGHPHWILFDEAHHLLPSQMDMDSIPAFNNFILISTSPHALNREIVKQVGMMIVLGENTEYPIEQFCKLRDVEMPQHIPSLAKGQAAIWDVENNQDPYSISFNMPNQLMQRHKKKYASGDMAGNSFIFTGPENKLSLKATNLIMFVHLAEGIDDDTWLFHLNRKDYWNWFTQTVHDEDLAAVATEAEKKNPNAGESKRMILDAINQKYTA
jgi:hydroxymethylpyrimidine pyrophosphatase-like HAD family hydrolase